MIPVIERKNTIDGTITINQRMLKACLASSSNFESKS